ncbi:MAG: CotH kinase family protein, partial [Limisphaerales bacterium]
MKEQQSPRWRGAIVVAVLWSVLVPGQAGELVPIDTQWKFRRGTFEEAPTSIQWRQPAFDDSAWEALPAPFWYGDAQTSPGTELTDMQNNYGSIFLRRQFQVTNPAVVSDLFLRMACDDGFMAWINGQEVARVNVPDGEPTLSTLALTPAIEPVQLESYAMINPPKLLVAGNNVLAVQVFNVNLDSSDLVFNAGLISSVDDSPPTIVGLLPPVGATMRALSSVEVEFSEPVTGVEAADFLINGQPATGLQATETTRFIFTFTPPSPGLVSLGWRTGHGITDTAPEANPFVGTNWTVTLDPDAPLPTLVISEFMADNETGLQDEDGSRSDWIEVHNPAPTVADLTGWFLTDSTNTLAKWRFPAVTLAPGGYRVVFASGKNRSHAAAPLHTNFKIAKQAGFLALVDPATNIVSAFSPAYPVQYADLAYGRSPGTPDVVGYLSPATPGQANPLTQPAVAPRPQFSLAGGVYATNVIVELFPPVTGATVRFTLDGSEPTDASTEYVVPITLSASTMVRAKTFVDGAVPSRTLSQTYTLAASSAAGFSSNLPLVVIGTFGRGVPENSRVNAAVAFIDTNLGRSRLLDEPVDQGRGSIEIRGQSSTGFPKKSYNLELQDERGDDRDFGPFGLPADSDWALYAPYTDKTFMNDVLAHEIWENMGHYAVRRRFVEVFLDSTGGKLNYPQDYQGIYVLIEKIKIDRNRLDLPKLSAADQAAPEITGGYVIKKDKYSPGDLDFSTVGGAGFSAQSFYYHEPKPREITTAQRNWIRNYLVQLEQTLYGANWKNPVTGYAAYLDVDSWVDFHWVVEFPKNIDGYRLSNYLSKDRLGRLAEGPIWDWNLSFGNADYLEGEYTQGWYWTLIGENDHLYLRRLVQDPDFHQRLIDRWSVLRTGVLNAA